MSRERLRIFQFTDDGGVLASLHSCEEVLAIEDKFLLNLEKKNVIEAFRRVCHVLSSMMLMKYAINGDSDHMLVTAATIKQGMLCVAERTNGMLSRAEVKDVLFSIKGPLVGLFFVDWCSENTQPPDRLYELPESFSSSHIPPLAQKLLLRCLKPTPTSAGGWGVAVMRILRSMSSSIEFELMADIYENSVDLYFENEREQVSVSDYLLKNRLAVKIDGTSAMQDEISDKKVTDLYICTKKPTMQQVNYIEQLKPKQKSYMEAFVTGDNSTDTIMSSLQAGDFPLTVCKELAELGFQLPTAAQAHAWPHISAGKDVFLVAPQNSGKTLAYLLPLLTALWKGTFPKDHDLTALVIVPTSSNAKSIYMQAKRILSWMPRDTRLRCAAGYAGVELEASCQLLNGANLLVCTPPSLLRLYANNTEAFSHIRYLVFDEATALLSIFPSETEAVFSELKLDLLQTVIMARKDSPELQKLTTRLRQNFTTILISPLEVAIRAGVTTTVVPTPISDRDRALSELLHKTYIEAGMQLTVCSVAILATTKEEAAHVSQYLSLNSWPVECIIVSCGDVELLAASKQKSTIIVVPDEAVPIVIEAGILIQGLIHYSIPCSKSSFCRRYGVLFCAVKCGTWCWCASLDDCTFSAPLLVEMMTRVGQEVPHVMKCMAMKELEDRETQLSSCGTQLCYYLKAFGECRLSTTCRSVHKIPRKGINVSSPQLLKLPMDGIVKVKVVHVSTASRWWVSILSHMPAAGTRDDIYSNLHHDSSLLIKMSIRMAEYYITPENRHLQGNLQEGTICAYCNSAGCYYRVQVLKFSEQLGFFFHHKEKARVRLIDLGHIEIVDVNQLLHLPQEFIEIPTQVIEVFLCRIKPRDNDTDWPQEANDLIVKHFLNKEVEGTIICCIDQTLWLDVEEQEIYDGGVQKRLMMATPQKLLLKNEYAEQNPHHLVMLKESLNIRTEVQHMQVSSNIRHTFLPLLTGQEVTITAVSSPGLFYVQLLEHQQQLCDLHHSIDSEMNTSLCIIRQSVSVGDYVVAKFPVDERWYRGVVMSCDGERNEIFFLDYGDTEWICSDLCYKLPKSMLEVPIQAIECKLNVASNNTKNWNSVNVADHLWDIGQENLLVAKVTGISLGQHSMHKRCYSVDLVIKDSGREVSDVLVELETTCVKANSWIQEFVDKLKLCSSVDEQISQVQVIHSYILHHASPAVSGDVIQCLLKFASVAPENVAIMLLRTIAGLLTFQSRVLNATAKSEKLSRPLYLIVMTTFIDVNEESLISVLNFLAYQSVQVNDITLNILQLIEPFLPQEIISRKSTIEPLMALLKRDVSIQTQSGVLQLLWCFVRRDQRCIDCDSMDLIQGVGKKSEKLGKCVEHIMKLVKGSMNKMFDCTN